jgi:large subunit ribosomal protein L24
MVGSPIKMKVKKGDEVVVLAGRDKGKKGEVLRVDRAKGKVLVQGVNLVKRHQRATMSSPGGINEFEALIHVSNVSLVDPSSGEATRAGYRTLDDGKKVRFAKRSGEVIDR